MGFYKFIKIKGAEAKRTGYFVPRLYQLIWSRDVVKAFGLAYVIDRLKGYTVWWVDNEADLIKAIETLDELKATRIFDYEVGRYKY